MGYTYLIFEILFDYNPLKDCFKNKRSILFIDMGLFSKKKFTILVVCKANITRSAYLHGYMEHYIKSNFPYAQKKIKIMSAGVRARGNCQAHQVVQHVARLNGFSLRHHSSSKLTNKLIQNASVILVMQLRQKEQILEKFPAAEGKVFRFTEYQHDGDAKEVADIPDPTGQNSKDYEEFIETAHCEVDRIFRELGRMGIY